MLEKLKASPVPVSSTRCALAREKDIGILIILKSKILQYNVRVFMVIKNVTIDSCVGVASP